MGFSINTLRRFKNGTLEVKFMFLDASASLEPTLRVHNTFGVICTIRYDTTFEILKNW